MRTTLWILGLALLIALCAMSPNAHADFSYPDFSSQTGLNLIGSASISGSSLRLTPSAESLVGAAWYGTRQSVAGGFEATFRFQLTEPLNGGADGFAFVVQDAAVTAMGPFAGYLGYDGIPRSLAVECDTYYHPGIGDPNDNHVSIQSRGPDPNSVNHAYSLGGAATAIPPLKDGAVHVARISYRPPELSVYVDNLSDPVRTIVVDLATLLDLADGKAWVGFTAATGLWAENHDILSWSFATSGTPPQVSSVVAVQRSGTTLVDVTYDLHDPDGHAMTVALYISPDGGVSFPVHCLTVSGDVGAGVMSGTGRHIEWDAEADYPGHVGETYAAKVIADYGQGLAGMAWIPAGNVRLGQTGIAEPVNDFYVEGFYSDRYEVSNAKYKAFIDAGGYTTQGYWNPVGWAWRVASSITLPLDWNSTTYHGGGIAGNEQFPVNGVSWWEADAYCRWAGARLPTEAEWEKAAKGGCETHGDPGQCDVSDIRSYPWGEGITGPQANYGGSNDPYENNGRTTPVGYYDGSDHDGYQTINSPSPYGLYDVAGNVWEWCSSKSASYPYDPNDNRESPPPSSNEYGRALRSGSFLYDTSPVRCANRNLASPDLRYYDVGFRSARTGFPSMGWGLGPPFHLDTSAGACCAPDGACTLVLQTACASPLTWSGATSCAPNPCSQGLSGRILAWGWNGDGQCNVPTPSARFVAIEGGFDHSLGLKSDGTIVAWGGNGSGQCNVPAPNVGFVAIAAGWFYSLGLKSDGTIVAWGANGSGQCNVPAPNADFVAVAAGQAHGLGVKSEGTVVAWGDNANGQCGVPLPNAGFVAVAAAEAHSLGLKSDGTIVAWGHNDVGQCNVPAPNADFVAVSVGGNLSLGLKSDGTIVAWGYNGQGQCNVPSPNANFAAVAAGGGHGLGLKADGTIVAWGWNPDGRCNVPTPNAQFIAIAAGGGHSLGLQLDGAPGTCCVPDGTCALVEQAGCASPNIWHSEWTACSPNPCAQPGACCDPSSAACNVILQSACTSPRTWNGAATCSPNPCSQPTGACCTTGGRCSLLLQANCASPSIWHSEWTVCSPNPCPPPQLLVPYCQQDGTQWCVLASTQMLVKYRSDALQERESADPPIDVEQAIWHMAKDLGVNPDDGSSLFIAKQWITDHLGWNSAWFEWTFAIQYDALRGYLQDRLGEGNPVAFQYVNVGLSPSGHAVVIVGATADSVYVSDPGNDFVEAMRTYGYHYADISTSRIGCAMAWTDFHAFLTGLNPLTGSTLCITDQSYESHRPVTVDVLPGGLSFLAAGRPLGLRWDGRRAHGYYYDKSSAVEDHVEHADLGWSMRPADEVFLSVRLSNSTAGSSTVKVRVRIQDLPGTILFADSVNYVLPAFTAGEAKKLFDAEGSFGTYRLENYPTGLYRLTVRVEPTGDGLLPDEKTLFFHVYAGSPPALEWSGTTGCETDGIDPNTGNANLFYEYRVNYRSPAGMPPMPGYPRMTIDADQDPETLSAGEGTFVLTPLGPETAYTEGRTYVFRTSLPFLPGQNYRYRFEAQDYVGLAAFGDPTEWHEGPLENYTDLATYANDITFTPAHAEPCQVFTIEARVHNESNDALGNVTVSFYDEEADTLIHQSVIALMAPGTWVPVSISYTFNEPGFYPVRVRVDEHNDIAEWNELNNNAVRGIIVGNYSLPAWIKVEGGASQPLCQIFDTVISGHASYQGVPQENLPVQGAEVRVTLREPGWQILGRTDDSGNFSIRFNTATLPPGESYHADVEITDFTVTGQASYSYKVESCIPIGPPLTCHELLPSWLWWICDWTLTLPQVPLPDLTLELEFDAGCIHRGETARPLAGRVRNVGTLSSAPCSAEIYVDQTLHYTAAIPALDPGGVHSLDDIPAVEFPSSMDVGGHTIYGGIDSGCQIEGGAPNSTSIGFTVWPDLPDAQAISLTPSTESPLTGQEITLTCRVSNQGGVPFSGEVEVEVVDNVTGSPSGSRITLGTLVPTPGSCGGIGYYVFNHAFSEAGEHILRLTADPSNQHIEWNEQNNMVDRVIAVRTPRPDFEITYQALQAVDPMGRPGDEVRFRAEVRNNGEADYSGDLPVRFRIDGSPLTPAVSIPGGIPRNEARSCTSAAYSTTSWISDPRNHDVEVKVDPENLIAEINENNNIAESPIPIDFTPVGISDCEMFRDTADPACNQVKVGDEVEIHARIKNLGCFETADSITVGFYAIALPSLEITFLGTATILSLGHHGADQDTYVTHVFQNAGFYQVEVRVDEASFWNGTDRWAEHTRENNTISRLLLVTTDLPDLTLSPADINPSLLTPCNGAEVTIDVTARNKGMAPAELFHLTVDVDGVQLGSQLTIPHLGFEALGYPPNYATVRADAALIIPETQRSAHVMHVVLDPENLVTEQSEDNNQATRIILYCEDVPDLYVLANEIGFDVLQGQGSSQPQGMLRCFIHNDGGRTADATVTYSDSVAGAWSFIGNQTVRLLPQSSVPSQVIWTEPPDDCFVRVKITGTQPPEYNMMNNSAQVHFDSPFSGMPDPGKPLPSLTRLYPGTPNPFNPSTTVQFDLPSYRQVRLEIFDVQGRLVRSLLDGRLPAGHYALRWDGRNEQHLPMGSGVFFLRMLAGDYRQTLKLVMTR